MKSITYLWERKSIHSRRQNRIKMLYKIWIISQLKRIYQWINLFLNGLLIIIWNIEI